MSKRHKTSVELRAALEAAQSRLLELRNTRDRLEHQMRMVDDEIRELAGFGSRYNRGNIGELEDGLAAAMLREKHMAMPTVRVIGTGGYRDYVVGSAGKKQIKLVPIGYERGDLYDAETGKAIGYGGTIHPEDLERIKREGR